MARGATTAPLPSGGDVLVHVGGVPTQGADIVRLRRLLQGRQDEAQTLPAPLSVGNVRGATVGPYPSPRNMRADTIGVNVRRPFLRVLTETAASRRQTRPNLSC